MVATRVGDAETNTGECLVPAVANGSYAVAKWSPGPRSRSATLPAPLTGPRPRGGGCTVASAECTRAVFSQSEQQ